MMSRLKAVSMNQVLIYPLELQRETKCEADQETQERANDSVTFRMQSLSHVNL